MSNILITGGAGFIGKHLVRHLLLKNHSVRILDTLSPQIHGAAPQALEWLLDERIDFVRASVTDPLAVKSSLEGVEQIVHLAAETGTGQSMYKIAQYCETNTVGTAVLLDELANNKSHSIRKIVLASSRSVYGEGAYICSTCGDPTQRFYPRARSRDMLSQHHWEPLCLVCGSALTAVSSREIDPVQPASIYAATKLAQEDLVRIACENMEIGYATLRLQNVYGESQSLNNPYTGILSIFSTRIRRNLELPIFEDGLETRDFVHVDDVARALYACLTSSEPENRVINVGSGIATTVLDVANLLVESLNGSAPLRITSEYRLGDIRHNVADIERLKDILPGGPKISLTDGINQFAAWVKTQPIPEDQLDHANAELRQRKLMA